MTLLKKIHTSRITTAIEHLVSILVPRTTAWNQCARMLSETCLKWVWSIMFGILRHIVRLLRQNGTIVF